MKPAEAALSLLLVLALLTIVFMNSIMKDQRQALDEEYKKSDKYWSCLLAEKTLSQCEKEECRD